MGCVGTCGELLRVCERGNEMQAVRARPPGWCRTYKAKEQRAWM